MRGAFARLLVVLAALMVLPGSAWGGVLYRCRMSGRVQATCCCHAAEKSAEPAASPDARASDCCERLTRADGFTATSPRLASDSLHPAALSALLPVPLGVGPARKAASVSAPQSRAPPGPRRPLFVVHCAYLC
jgi:hypothetical protein